MKPKPGNKASKKTYSLEEAIQILMDESGSSRESVLKMIDAFPHDFHRWRKARGIKWHKTIQHRIPGRRTK